MRRRAVACSVAIGLLASGCGLRLEADATMRERFRAHRGTLEQVVSLFRSNPALWLLIDDTARGEDGREIHDLHHLGAVLSRSSFPAKAGRDREAHARGVFAVVFPADAAGVVISDAEKGIVYLDTPPTKLRKDLDTRWVGDCETPPATSRSKAPGTSTSTTTDP